MRLNSNLVLEGSRVLLVPYRKEHVDNYHRWMQDPHLQETTESEPLSLEEEYAMQQSWYEDEDKCTFILLDPSLPDTEGTGRHGGGMAGDVNLYFNDHDTRQTAEIEVMVAEPACRRKGMAREALELIMAFAHSRLQVTCFRAKILEHNAPSIQLFTSMGFAETQRVECFNEVHFELAVTGGAMDKLVSLASQLKSRKYDEGAAE